MVLVWLLWALGSVTASLAGARQAVGVWCVASQAILLSTHEACAQHWHPGTVLGAAAGLVMSPFAQLGLRLYVWAWVRV